MIELKYNDLPVREFYLMKVVQHPFFMILNKKENFKSCAEASFYTVWRQQLNAKLHLFEVEIIPYVFREGPTTHKNVTPFNFTSVGFYRVQATKTEICSTTSGLEIAEIYSELFKVMSPWHGLNLNYAQAHV